MAILRGSLGAGTTKAFLGVDGDGEDETNGVDLVEEKEFRWFAVKCSNSTNLVGV